MLKSLLSLAIAFFLFPALSAHAAIDAGGAAHLRAALAAEIGGDKKAGLMAGGPITVTPAGDHYAVLLPRLSYRDAEGRLAIGDVTLNARPAGPAGLWDMTMALTSPMSASDNRGALRYTLSVQGQAFAGQWSENFGGFTKIDGTYDGVTLDALQAGGIQIDKLHLTGALTAEKNRAWAGPLRLDAGGIVMPPRQDGDMNPPADLPGLVPDRLLATMNVSGVPANVWTDPLNRLRAAGAVLDLTALNLHSGLYTATGHGKARLSEAAHYGLTGQGRVTVAGLDKVLDAATARLQAAKPLAARPADFLSRLAAAAAIMQLVGQPDAGGGRAYDLAVDEAGHVQLNGADIGSLLPHGAKIDPAPNPVPPHAPRR